MEKETLWERTRHAFEAILEESRKATERVVETVGDAQDQARLRLEKARLERTLFKAFGALGSDVYERARTSDANVSLEDLKPRLDELRSLDRRLAEVKSRLERASRW